MKHSLAVGLALLACSPQFTRAQATTPLTLGEAADAAVTTHPALRAARARVDVAEAVGDRSRSLLRPSLTGSLAVTHFAEPMVVAPLHRFDAMSPPTFDRTLVQSQFGALYTLFDGGARRARVRDADATVWCCSTRAGCWRSTDPMRSSTRSREG